nr:MAG TPA: hypothetical protein [Caudoviricetes sp.]DAG46065.1 MAG TPA: hypothetical protein [Caudoviricetes sp.]DAH23146.1 MAG TPA: hypothetical protein [Caudoviricetes sp.]
MTNSSLQDLLAYLFWLCSLSHVSRAASMRYTETKAACRS